MKQCPYCAEEIADEAIYCRYCKHDLVPKSRKNNKFFIVATIIILLLLLASSIIFIYFNNEQYTNTIITYEKSQKTSDAIKETKLAEQKSLIATATNSLHILKSTLEANVSNLEATNQSLSGSLDHQLIVYATLKAKNSDLSKSKIDLEAEISKYSDSECIDKNFIPNYSNNSTMASALKAYVEDISGSVTESSYDVLWNDSKDSFHRFTTLKGTERVGHYFLVFFNSKFKSEGVFWMNRQCWLDR